MANYNVTWKRYNGTGYDTLYPETTGEQITGAVAEALLADNSSKFNDKTYAEVVADIIGQMPETGMRIVSGTYTGTGSTTKQLTIGGITQPKLIIVHIVGSTADPNYVYVAPMVAPLYGTGGYRIASIGIESTPTVRTAFNTMTISTGSTNSTISWTNDANSSLALNASNRVYNYMVMGY